VTRRDVKKLNPGDEVFWTDPDEGICSKVYTIHSIEVRGSVVIIKDTNGSELECFAGELS
jgi:hypothetical protein